MTRLTKEEIKNIEELIRSNTSLNKISLVTKRAKSTLYPYYFKLKGKKIKQIKINYFDDEFLGEVIGLFIGDGYLFHEKSKGRYSVRFAFNVTELSFVKELVNLFEDKFKKKPGVNKESNNVLTVRYYSREIFNFLLKYVEWKVNRDIRGNIKKSRTVRLKDKVYSNNFKIGFFKGLY